MSISSFADVDGTPGSAMGREEGLIEILAYHYTLNVPTDPRDGTITGHRRHGFYSITQEMGKHSPVFFKFLTNHMVIPKVTVYHYVVDPTSDATKRYYRHVMVNVRILEITQSKPNTCDPASRLFRDMEEVRFSFTGISFSDMEGNEFNDSFQ